MKITLPYTVLLKMQINQKLEYIQHLLIPVSTEYYQILKIIGPILNSTCCIRSFGLN
jgi:hypothetical protein